MFASRNRDRDRDGEEILKIKRETRKFPRRVIHLQFQRSLSFFPRSGLISYRIARPRQNHPPFLCTNGQRYTGKEREIIARSKKLDVTSGRALGPINDLRSCLVTSRFIYRRIKKRELNVESVLTVYMFTEI